MKKKTILILLLLMLTFLIYNFNKPSENTNTAFAPQPVTNEFLIGAANSYDMNLGAVSGRS